MESEEVYIRLDGDDDEEGVMNECEIWPIYCDEYISSLKTLPILQLAGIKEVPEDKLCKSVPQIEVTGEAKQISFMLDHSYVPAGDASTDNLGVWNNRKHRMASRLFYIRGDEQCNEEDCEYIIRRRFYNHANAQPFGSVRKMVWMLYRRDGVAYRSLISYRIDEGGAIISTKHGNAKISQRLYRRTYPSTLERMKELRKTLSPRQVLSAMIAEQGGISNVVNRQALPRDRSQLYNLSRCRLKESDSNSATSRNDQNETTTSNDPSTTLQDLFRTVGNNGFVRAASHGVEGDCVFFATDMMLESFKASCTMNVAELEEEISELTPPSSMDSEHLYKYFHDFGRVQISQHGHSPVLIHRSHQLAADMHIVVIAFQNRTITVNLSNRNSSLSIAAFALCTKAEVNRYINVARFLLSSVGFDENLRVRSLISDISESAIAGKSCQLFAPPTIHVRCGLHLAEDTERKLTEIGIDIEGCRSIMRDIYGIDSPLSSYRYEGGLVDSVSDNQFESSCADLIEKWRRIAPCFPSFFVDYQKDAIKKGYLLPLRFAAGVDIGFVSATDIRRLDDMIKDAFRGFTTNFGANDIINALYKCATGENVKLGTIRFGLSVKRSHSQKRSWNCTSLRQASFALKKRQQLVTSGLHDDDADTHDDDEDLEISTAVLHLNSADESHQAVDNTPDFVEKKISNFASSRRKTYLRMDVSDEDNFLHSPSSSVNISSSLSSARSIPNRTIVAAIAPFSPKPTRFFPVSELLPSEELVRAAWQTSNRVFTRPFHNQNQFYINFYGELQTEESMCASCGVDFPKGAPAPENVVIVHEERYSLPDGSFTDKATRNRVLHCRLMCILRRYPYFTVPEFLTIAPSVLERLTEKHERHMQQQFGDFIFMARWKAS